MQGRIDIINLPQGCSPLMDDGCRCLAGFFEALTDAAHIRIRPEPADDLLRHLTAGLLPEHVNDLVILQHLECLLIHPFSCTYQVHFSV